MLFNWTRQSAQIFKEVLFFEATYNTIINNQFTNLLPVESSIQLANDKKIHFLCIFVLYVA